MFHNVLERLVRHDIAHCGKALRRALPDDGKLTAQGELEHREDLGELGMEVGMESRHDSLQDAQRVYHVLTKLFLDELVSFLGGF